MKIFCMSDIHGAVGAIAKAGPLISQSDLVVVAGDITRLKNREEAEQVISAIERFNRRILAVHGNWDRSEVCTFLEEQGYSLHGQGRVIDEVGFFGLGGSSPTPMQTATEYSEEEMTRYLEDGYKAVRDCAQIVLISHCPPQGLEIKPTWICPAEAKACESSWKSTGSLSACAVTSTRRAESRHFMAPSSLMAAVLKGETV